MPAEEWAAFLAALKRPLPTTFRINGSSKFAADLRDHLAADFPVPVLGGAHRGVPTRTACPGSCLHPCSSRQPAHCRLLH